MAAYRRVDDLTVTCRLTACIPGSAPGPTLGIEYGKPLPFLPYTTDAQRHEFYTRSSRIPARPAGIPLVQNKLHPELACTCLFHLSSVMSASYCSC